MPKRQADLRIEPQIGERLRAARSETGLNQTDFARLGGVSLHSQGRYENGELPSFEYLLRLGEAGVDWYWVVSGSRVSGRAISDSAAQLIAAFDLLGDRVRMAVLSHVQALVEATVTDEQPET